MASPIPEPEGFAKLRRRAIRRNERLPQPDISGSAAQSALSLVARPPRPVAASENDASSSASDAGHDDIEIVPHSLQPSLLPHHPDQTRDVAQPWPPVAAAGAAGAVSGIAAQNVQVVNNFYPKPAQRNEDWAKASASAGQPPSGAPPGSPPHQPTAPIGSGGGAALFGMRLFRWLSNSLWFYLMITLAIYATVHLIKYYITSTVSGAVASISGVLTATGSYMLGFASWIPFLAGNLPGRGSPPSTTATSATGTYTPLAVRAPVINTAGLDEGIKLMSKEIQSGNTIFTSLLVNHGAAGAFAVPVPTAMAGLTPETMGPRAVSLQHKSDEYTIKATAMILRERAMIARIRALLQDDVPLPPARSWWCGYVRYRCSPSITDILENMRSLINRAEKDRIELMAMLQDLSGGIAIGMKTEICAAYHVASKAVEEEKRHPQLREQRESTKSGHDGTKAFVHELAEALVMLRQYNGASMLACGYMREVLAATSGLIAQLTGDIPAIRLRYRELEEAVDKNTLLRILEELQMAGQGLLPRAD